MKYDLTTTELLSSLNQFTGTTQYYQVTTNTVLTDGTKYLADTASCYWLIDVFASHLVGLPESDGFAVCNLTLDGRSAELVIDDGNDQELSRQFIEWTDFPLPSIKLFACWSGNFWVLMLPSEY